MSKKIVNKIKKMISASFEEDIKSKENVYKKLEWDIATQSGLLKGVFLSKKITKEEWDELKTFLDKLYEQKRIENYDYDEVGKNIKQYSMIKESTEKYEFVDMYVEVLYNKLGKKVDKQVLRDFIIHFNCVVMHYHHQLLLSKIALEIEEVLKKRKK